MTNQPTGTWTHPADAVARRDRAQRWVFGLTAALAVGAVSATSATAAVLAAQAGVASQAAGQSNAQALGASGQNVQAAAALRPPKQPLASPTHVKSNPAPAATTTGS